MCLPNLIENRIININTPIVGYRNWLLPINNGELLKSLNQNYEWNQIIEGPHEVLESNSGIYSYNNNNYYNNYYYNYGCNNNYYNYYDYNYGCNNNYYNYYYNIGGIIHQWGNVAIHKNGYRSEYAKIVKLFSIRESDAKGPIKFINWIKQFNKRIDELSKKYECEVISWQDFIESDKG